MKQLSGLDTFFLHGETAKQAMNLTGLGIYDPSTRADPVTFEAVLEHARERTRRSGLFRRKLASLPILADFPYWTEDHAFSIERHVYRLKLPAPGGRRALHAATAQINAGLIDRDKPLWEWWFIEGLGEIDGIPPGCFAVAFKLHHAAFDGVSGWEVIDVSHDKEPGYQRSVDRAAQTAQSGTAEEGPTLAEMTFNLLKRAATTPYRLTQAMVGIAPIVAKTARGTRGEFPLDGGAPAPTTRFNKPLGSERVHGSLAIPMESLRPLRQIVSGATINDAVLTIIAGAMRRYLAAKSELPDDSLVVGVPISIRAPGDEGEAGNQAILTALPIGTDIADPIARLHHVRGATQRKKDFTQTIPAHRMTDLVEFMPGAVQMAAVRTFTGLRMAAVLPGIYNFIVTNVPASRVPLYFMGAKMVAYDAAGPIWDGATLIHVVTSYLGILRCSFYADARGLPDPQEYERCLAESFEECLAAAAAWDQGTTG